MQSVRERRCNTWIFYKEPAILFSLSLISDLLEYC